jgi:hypothetical protein
MVKESNFQSVGEGFKSLHLQPTITWAPSQGG